MHYTVVHVLFDVNLAESSHPVPSRSSRSAYLVRPRLSREHGRAIYEWREAYGAAMGSRRAEALASVGDAALRIDALAAARGVFRAEARDAYQGSMLLAHAQRDVRTMMRAADSLAQLGDTRAAEAPARWPRDWPVEKHLEPIGGTRHVCVRTSSGSGRRP